MKTYGSDAKAVAWRDRERQLRRFQIFTGLFETVSTDMGLSVNDLGCGYGAMFEAYRDLPAFQNAHYYGYDISTGMLHEARANISDPRAVWIHSHEATHDADFSFVSGTYNLNMKVMVTVLFPSPPIHRYLTGTESPVGAPLLTVCKGYN